MTFIRKQASAHAPRLAAPVSSQPGTAQRQESQDGKYRRAGVQGDGRAEHGVPATRMLVQQCRQGSAEDRSNTLRIRQARVIDDCMLVAEAVREGGWEQ